jgi:hypothetical protein
LESGDLLSTLGRGHKSRDLILTDDAGITSLIG